MKGFIKQTAAGLCFGAALIALIPHQILIFHQIGAVSQPGGQAFLP